VGRLVAGAEPHHFAFTAGRVWASDNGGSAVVRIDERAREVLGRTPVGPAPHHVTAVGSGVLVAVNGRGTVTALSPRGRVRDVVPVGAGPHGLAAVPLP
jgi:hypothetical protein